MHDLTGVLDVETTAQQLAQQLTRSLPVTLAGLAFRDRSSGAFVVRTISSVRPVTTSLRVGAKVPLSTVSRDRDPADAMKSVVVEGRLAGVAASAPLEPALSGDLRSVYLVPIRLGSEAIGVLTLGEMRALEREPFTQEKWRRCRALLDEFVAATSHVWEAMLLRRQLVAMSSIFRLVREVLEARSFDELLACSAAEVADWLAAPVRGILFRVRPGGSLEVVARRHMPDSLTEADIGQIVSALVRFGGHGEWSVGIARVANDPLDPLHAATEAGEAWTRVSLPLMHGDGLLGVVCLYVGEDLLFGQPELEALRRRGEIATLGMILVESRLEHERERERLGRTAWELQQTLVGVVQVVSSFLRTRLEGWTQRRDAATEAAPSGQAVGTVTAEMGTVLNELVESVAASEGGTPGPVEVNQLVRHAIEIARAKWAEGRQRRSVSLELTCELASEPLMAQASMALVGVLVHAIESAVETMPAGGQVMLRTARHDGHIVISVHDARSGVGEDLRKEVLSQPFSTKGEPHPGLGLSVVRAFVTHYGGTVSPVSPGPGGGIAVEIRFPAASVAQLGG